MAKDIVTYRELSKRPVSHEKGPNGELIGLYEVSFRGHKLLVPNSVRQEMKDMAEWLNDPHSDTVRRRREFAKGYEEDVLKYVQTREEERLASFLSRMPKVVEGMLKASQSGYFDVYTQQHIKDIVNVLAQMSEYERDVFYDKHGDLFADMTDYYNLLKRYAFSPGKTFAIDEKDLEKLHEKGYSSFEEYKTEMERNIQAIRDILKTEHPKYYDRYKSGKFKYSSKNIG